MPDRYRPPPPRRPWLGGFAGRFADSGLGPRIVLIVVATAAIIEIALLVGKHVLGIHGLPEYTGMPATGTHKQVASPRTLEEAVDELVGRHGIHDMPALDPAASHPPIEAVPPEPITAIPEASSVTFSLVMS